MADEQKSYAEMSESEKKKEDWMNSKWRPMMGWMYMAVCTCDFILFPVLWSLLQALIHASQITQWQPLTLQGAGLFHIAMGAVLGLAAWGRTQEKLGGANNGGIQTPTPSAGFSVPAQPAYTPPVAAPMPAARPVLPAGPVVSSSGKLAPPPAPEPEL